MRNTAMSKGVRGSCGIRPLRPPASLLHNAANCPQCPSVAARKFCLVPVTASRPSGEGNRRYAKWPSLEAVVQPSALPGRWPIRPMSGHFLRRRSIDGYSASVSSRPLSWAMARVSSSPSSALTVLAGAAFLVTLTTKSSKSFWRAFMKLGKLLS